MELKDCGDFGGGFACEGCAAAFGGWVISVGSAVALGECLFSRRRSASATMNEVDRILQL
jgi:hypothetical protein